MIGRAGSLALFPHVYGAGCRLSQWIIPRQLFSTMKLTILGATGPTGLELVKIALVQGHEVIALVRNPDKLTTKHEKLQVQQLDILKDDLDPYMFGSDAVMSCLGAKAGIWTPCSLYTDSVSLITSAMRRNRVHRLVCISAWGSKHDPGLPRIIRWFLRPLFLRNILPNMGEMEDYLSEKCQDLDYTVVRPPALTNKPSSGTSVQTYEGQYVPGALTELPRQDLAKFMLECVTKEQWKKKMVAVGFF